MGARFGYESTAGGKSVLCLDFWLTVGRGEGYSDRPSVRATATYPKLARNERTINLKMELPIALFETPSMVARIRVDAPEQVVTIDAETIAEAVRGVIGMDVDIRIAGND